MIKQFLKSHELHFDIIAVGHQGLNRDQKEREVYLGTVSTSILRAKLMNCLYVAWIIKN